MKISFCFPSRTNERWLFGLCASWTLLVFYYYFPPKSFLDFSFVNPILSDLKSFQFSRFFANWAGFLKTFFCTLAIAFTLWQWGRRFYFWLGLKLKNRAMEFCVETALAIVFFNSIWLSLGLNGLWSEPFLFLLALVSLLVALWDFRSVILSARKLSRPALPGSWSGLAAGMGFLILLLCLKQCLVPQVYYDALVYHLSTLQFWLDRHGITDFHTNLYSHYPFGAELFFLNGFFLAGTEAAKMLNALAAVLLAVTIAGWIREEQGPAYGWLAWGMVLMLPLVAANVWANQNDVALAFFLVLFFISLTRWTREKDAVRWALMSGLWAGAALTVKYTAVFGIGSGFLALLLTQRHAFGRIKKEGWFCLLFMAALPVVPWVLKNWTYTGNAFYPYFSDWVGGKALPPERFQALMADHQAGISIADSFLQWLKQIFIRDLDKTVAPVFFSFLPFLFLPGKRRPLTVFLMVTAALMLVSGFTVSHQLRLMIPAFMVCFLAMARVLGELKKTKWALPLFSCGLLIFGAWSLLSLLRLSVQYYQSQPVWLGKLTPDEYLAASHQTTSYYDLTQAAKRLPERDRLLVVGDARGLYYPRPFYTNSAFDEPVLCALARKAKNGRDILKGLKRIGVDELVVSGREGRRLAGQGRGYDLTAGEWRLLEDFIQRHTDLVYLIGLNAIYRLRQTPADGRRAMPNNLLLLRKD